MKKRVLAGMMMAVMVLATAMSVSAAPSKTNTVTVTGSSAGKYVVSNDVSGYDAKIDSNEAIKDKEAAKKAVAEALEKVKDVNEGKKVVISAEVDRTVEGKTVVQNFFDISEVQTSSTGTHTIVLSVDTMTTSWKNIVIVHYSVTRATWETIIPTVDYDKKTLTFEVKDLSPFAIYADVVTEGSNGKAPGTEGRSSVWMLCTAMALVVMGAGVVAYQKKRR